MGSRFWSLLRALHGWDVALSARIAFKSTDSQSQPRGYWPALLMAHLGDSWLWLLIAALLFASAYRFGAPVRRHRFALIWTWLSGVIAATVATLVVKRQVQRPRPGKRQWLYGRGADVHSFPSGHAARLGAVAVWGNLLWPKWGWFTWGLAVAVGWSRIALGIHYAGDVLVGWLLGGMIGLFFRRLGRQHRLERNRR